MKTKKVQCQEPGKGPFWRKQENLAQNGARLRGSRATEPNGNASQMPYVANGTKGHATNTTVSGPAVSRVFSKRYSTSIHCPSRTRQHFLSRPLWCVAPAVF